MRSRLQYASSCLAAYKVICCINAHLVLARLDHPVGETRSTMQNYNGDLSTMQNYRDDLRNCSKPGLSGHNPPLISVLR